MTDAYRKGVGIVVRNAQGRVLVGCRLDMVPDHWNLPQGGIENEDEPLDAAFREVSEELNLSPAHLHVEAVASEWLRYDIPLDKRPTWWGGRYRGQTQLWYLMRFLGQDADISVETAHPEFRAWQWMSFERLYAQVVPFKRDLYQAIGHEFKLFKGE